MEVIGIFKEINKLMHTDFDYMNCIFMPNKNVKLLSDNNTHYFINEDKLYVSNEILLNFIKE